MTGTADSAANMADGAFLATGEGQPGARVVVVTGASSGIGRATALAFAERGDSVVIAARREAPLQELAAECEQRGGRALAVPADTSDEAAVQELARRAVERFGRLDVWVNNAGVALFGRFEDLPAADFRQVLETNFFGYVYGARAALPHFRRRGRGVLINNASINGVGGAPYATAYVAAKFAVRGFSESLRQELRGTDVSVCTILPASIDTPLFQHAGNYVGRAAKPLNPTYDPEQVARAIVHCADKPRREVIVGNAGRTLALLHSIAPALYERTMAKQVEQDEFQDTPAPPSPGNLYEPVPAGTGASGGWKDGRSPSSPARRLAIGAGIAAPAALLGWSWLRLRRTHA